MEVVLQGAEECGAIAGWRWLNQASPALAVVVSYASEPPPPHRLLCCMMIYVGDLFLLAITFIPNKLNHVD